MRTIHDEKVIAIVCADIHLSHTAPLARAKEPNWYAAMRRPLEELAMLAMIHNCPILCAGDVFDHWKAPPELINFAIDYLPVMYAIPGQHDLPLHNLADLHKSAYATLMKAGRIRPLRDMVYDLPGFPRVWGFSWNVPVTRPSAPPKGVLNVALQHAYRWIPGAEYTGADESTRVLKKGAAEYAGYDVVIIGDNHKPWEIVNPTSPTIFNCGGFMRRKSDDTHNPRVGLLHPSGAITPHFLDTQDERHSTTVKKEEDHQTSQKVKDFVSHLLKFRGTGDEFDYNAAVRQTMDKMKVDPRVRRNVEEALAHGDIS